MQEDRKKPEGLINRHLRSFAFWRNSFISEGDSKTPAAFETKLLVTLANGWKLLAHVTWRSIQDMTI